MPTLAAPLDFVKLEARNLRAHQLAAAPGSPVTGQLYYDTGSNTLFYYNGTTWVAAGAGAGPADATTSTKGIVQLAGDLAGTAASPQIAAGAITDADVNAANKDGAVAVASMRTLGSGAQQAMPGNRTLDAIPAPAADVSFNTKKIIGLADPIAGTDGANKQYVDGVAQGLDVKASVKAATTANIATLAGGAPNTLDGVTLAANDRVLVKDQTTQNQNGIYTVTTLGSGANGTWTRVTDMDAWTEVPGAFVFVEQGTVNADTGWACTADQGGTLGTTSITWTQFAGAGEYIGGAGLLKTGNVFDVGGTANRISVGTDTIDIAATYVGQASITTLGTITTGVWTGTPIAVANGGTGQTTAKAARETGLSAPGYYNNAATHGAGTTITITAATHGLRATRALVVQCQDNATGNVEIPDVAVAANGDVTITFGASVGANTKLITIIG